MTRILSFSFFCVKETLESFDEKSYEPFAEFSRRMARERQNAAPFRPLGFTFTDVDLFIRKIENCARERVESSPRRERRRFRRARARFFLGRTARNAVIPGRSDVHVPCEYVPRESRYAAPPRCVTLLATRLLNFNLRYRCLINTIFPYTHTIHLPLSSLLFSLGRGAVY